MKFDRNRLLKYVVAGLCITIVLAIVFYAQPVLADVGNNNRYGNGSSSSGSSSSDSGIVSLIFWFLFQMLGPIPGLIIIVIIIIVYFYFKKTGKLNKIKEGIEEAQRNLNSTVSSTVTGATTMNNTKNVGELVRESDPAFSEDAFLGWAKEVFVKIQQAWSAREWKTIRPFESNELFSQHSAQLQEYITNNKINMIEKVAVKYCALKEFRQDGDKDVMVVELHSVMRDYVVEATSKKVLESDPNKDWNMKYLMTFNRKAGVKTHPGTSNKSTTNCPNCGAPTEITSAGQCEYCTSVITTGEHDWVLSDITSIN